MFKKKLTSTKINTILKLPEKLSPTFYIFIFCFVLLNCIFVIKLYNKNESKKDFIRLHVVANSNSIYDQIIKLKISTKIEKYINSLNIDEKLNTCEKLKVLKDKYNDIIEISSLTLKENNILYDTKLNIGKINYDTKENSTLNMEKGIYNSVQLVLGDGKGKNFWTLIFPNEKSLEKIQDYETILPSISNIFKNDANDKNDLIYTFKSIEIINNIRESIKKATF